MQTRFTLRCIQSGQKCSFISLWAPYPFNKYKFLIKILSSSVKVILFIYITTVVCQCAWLPWKPCSWYSTRTKLFELNQSATEWWCLVWKIIMGELILMNLCRPALGVVFFETQCVTVVSVIWSRISLYYRPEWLQTKNVHHNPLDKQMHGSSTKWHLSGRNHQYFSVFSCQKLQYEVFNISWSIYFLSKCMNIKWLCYLSRVARDTEVTFAAQWHFGDVILSNVILCDICCFSSKRVVLTKLCKL